MYEVIKKLEGNIQSKLANLEDVLMEDKVFMISDDWFIYFFSFFVYRFDL